MPETPTWRQPLAVANPDAIAVTLNKIDLIDRKFSRALFGYSRDEVDRLVAEAADTIGRLAEDKMALSRTVESLRRDVSECQSRETELRDTLLAAQRSVEELKAEARQEAERTVTAAREKAAAIVSEAEDQVVALGEELDALQERRTSLVTKFREMLTFSLDLLEAETSFEASPPGSGEPADPDLPGDDAGATSEEQAGDGDGFLFESMPGAAPDPEK